MAHQDLGAVRKELMERYLKRSSQVKAYVPADLIADKLEKRIRELLSEYGLNYPWDFDRPPPDVYAPGRRGTCYLDSYGTTTGTSPPIATDQKCLTFRARDGGFLVIDYLDIIMEGPIAEEWFNVTYRFDEQYNSANFQCDKAIDECGHWEFNRVVLMNHECLTVCVQNTNPYAGGWFSYVSRDWSL